MGREIKRVALNFDWPRQRVWDGYVPSIGMENVRKDPPAGDGWQVWENVSEGSPITPVLPTKEAMIDYLVNTGDDWDGPVSREAAENFVEIGFVPSMIFTNRGCLRGIAAAEFMCPKGKEDAKR